MAIFISPAIFESIVANTAAAADAAAASFDVVGSAGSCTRYRRKRRSIELTASNIAMWTIPITR